MYKRKTAYHKRGRQFYYFVQLFRHKVSKFDCNTTKQMVAIQCTKLFGVVAVKSVVRKTHASARKKQMSTLKDYAKRAKERMKNGFWEQAKQQFEEEKQVAATLGISPHKIAEEQHRKLQRQIYDYDGFCEEQEFYAKVVQILTSAQTVSNPLMRLADQEYMAKLTPEQKQTYIQKLAQKYRQAVDKYNSLHG